MPSRPASRVLLSLCIAALLVAGCAGMRRWSHPVSVTEIVHLSKNGVPPDEIIAKLNRAGTIYHLTDAQYDALRKKGVTPSVIAYMKKSYAQAVEKHPELAKDEHLNCWYLGWDGFWYGGGPFGFHPDCATPPSHAP
jgi:hypothetical protein